MTEQQIMQIAWDEASKTPGSAYGAVVVKHGQVIAHDHHHVMEGPDVSAHSEISAMRLANKKLGYSLEGCKLYCTYAPCEMCIAAACWAKIDEIIYNKAKAEDPEPHIISDVTIEDYVKFLGAKIKVRRLE